MLNVVSLGLCNEQLYSCCLKVALSSSHSDKHGFVIFFFFKEKSLMLRSYFPNDDFPKAESVFFLEALAVITSTQYHTCKVIWVLGCVVRGFLLDFFFFLLFSLWCEWMCLLCVVFMCGVVLCLLYFLFFKYILVQLRKLRKPCLVME